MRALGPYLLSRCCASALLSPFGLDGELGKDLVDRQLLEVDRGLRSALGRSRSGLQGNGGHGLLLATRLRESKKGVSKDNAMWLMGRHQRPPIAPDIAQIPTAGAVRKRRSRIWLVVRLLYGALEGVRHRQLDVDGARRDRLLEPLRIEFLELARAHQLGKRFIYQCF